MSRIIAGSRGGRRIATPPGDRTRPTTDRVREALFSAIASWAGTGAAVAEQSLAGLAFCDLYAGSGAVGLEAASRGARPVLLVESDRRTSQLTRRNAKDLALDAQMRTGKVEQLVRQPADAAYDVVFADPPYEVATEAMDLLLIDLADNGWVSPDGLVVVERSRRTPAVSWPGAFAEHWDRSYGETVLCFGAR